MKIIYIVPVVILTTISFFLGWYSQKPAQVCSEENQKEITYGPNFNRNQPYLPFIYDQCPTDNIPEGQACATNLFNATQKEADLLANTLAQKSTDFYVRIQAVKNLKEDYIKAYCELDGMLIRGGTGELREIAACRYYSEKQYLELLKAINQKQ